MVHDSLFCGGRVGRGGGRVGRGVFPDAPYFQNYHHIPITTSSIPPSLQCNTPITSSFLALPIILQRREGEDLSIPAIGRFFLEPSLLKRDIDAIKRFHNAPWSPWSYRHEKNYLHQEIIKRTSPCWGSTAHPLIRSWKNLPQCFQGTHLSTSQGWLLNLSTSEGEGEWFSQRIALG